MRPSLTGKPASPHVIRRTTAMHLLQAGLDPATIAPWLGAELLETTQVCRGRSRYEGAGAQERTRLRAGRPSKSPPARACLWRRGTPHAEGRKTLCASPNHGVNAGCPAISHMGPLLPHRRPAPSTRIGAQIGQPSEVDRGFAMPLAGLK